jgi:hypothetical protein
MNAQKGRKKCMLTIRRCFRADWSVASGREGKCDFLKGNERRNRDRACAEQGHKWCSFSVNVKHWLLETSTEY